MCGRTGGIRRWRVEAILSWRDRDRDRRRSMLRTGLRTRHTMPARMEDEFRTCDRKGSVDFIAADRPLCLGQLPFQEVRVVSLERGEFLIRLPQGAVTSRLDQLGIVAHRSLLALKCHGESDP